MNKYCYLKGDYIEAPKASCGNCKEYNQPCFKQQGTDLINNPPHYTYGKYQTWDVIEDWRLDYFMGCALKYISRADHKGKKVEDLKKAIAYIEKEIDITEENNGIT